MRAVYSFLLGKRMGYHAQHNGRNDTAGLFGYYALSYKKFPRKTLPQGVGPFQRQAYDYRRAGLDICAVAYLRGGFKIFGDGVNILRRGHTDILSSTKGKEIRQITI